MQVKELIEILSGLDQEATIRMAVKRSMVVSLCKTEVLEWASPFDKEDKKEYLLLEGEIVENISWNDVIERGWTEP